MYPILVIAVSVSPSIACQEPADEGTAPAAAAPAIPADLPDSVREELAMLEARLRIRDARVREAERYLALEQFTLDETRREQRIGAVSPRQVELDEIRFAEVETRVETRRAERAIVAEMLDALRRRIASPSPEPDLDELRALVAGEVRAAEARLRAQESRLKAAELQVESDLVGREAVLRAIRSGAVSPQEFQLVLERTKDVVFWRDLMEAERDLARIAWERHRRRLDAFDRGDRSDDDLDPSRSADVKARLDRLETEVQVLRDEVYFLEERRR